MPKFHIEEDVAGIETTDYIVEADTREDAIQQVTDGKCVPAAVVFRGNGTISYEDSHPMPCKCDVLRKVGGDV